jgi:predicted NBD/HSP70 family sugar kinase
VAQPQKATHQQTRVYNQQLVLRTIYDHAPVSRADLARLTGLTRTSVSDLVGDLLGTGLAEEIGRGPSSGGKAPILLHVVEDARQLIGIDLGDTVFAGALVNLRGEVRHALELPLDGADGDDALRLVNRLVEQLVAAADRPLLGIGIGTPGIVDTPHGTVRWAVNLDWQDLPIGPLIAKRFGLPTHVANDSQAAALAEYLFGGHKRGANMVVVKVGRGIGAGIILDGRLYQGDGFGAGEIGHTTVVDDGAACRCGSFGCLETVASGRAIVEHVRHLAPRRTDTDLRRPAGARPPELEDIVDAFQAGDPLAREVVLEAGSRLGASLAPVVGALNVERVVLVGAVAAFGEPWAEAVRAEIQRRAFALLARSTSIELGHLRANVVVLGASALLMTRELGLSLAR